MRDVFVANNGCTPVGNVTAPALGSGEHVKTVYQDCKIRYPLVWVELDGLHTPTPKDKDAGKTWAPEEVWVFLSQFNTTS
jgi:hypothetical protein